MFGRQYKRQGGQKVAKIQRSFHRNIYNVTNKGFHSTNTSGALDLLLV